MAAQERPTVRVIADLITSDLHAQGGDPISRVAELWDKHPGVDGLAVLDPPRVLYLSRARFFVQLGKRFGYALFENRPVSLLAEEGSTVEADMDPVEVISIATQREPERIYDDILVLDQRRFRGLVSMRSLLVHHKALLVNAIEERGALEERNRHLQALNSRQGEFMGSLTHDLRGPMSTLLGISQSLLTDPDTKARHEKSLRALLLGAQESLAMVNDLDDVVKLARGTLKPQSERVDLSTLVEGVVASLSPLLADRSTRLELLCEEMPSQWITDPLFLRRILSNLLRAAIEGTAGQPVAFEAGSSAGKVVFRIGPAAGLEALERTRVLPGPAEPAPRLRQGRAALRLSAVKALVEGLGGTLEPDHALAPGAIVSVRIPSL